MPVSSKHTGWRYDPSNSRLDYYYQGTRVGHINASGLSTAGSEITNSVVQSAGIAANAVTPGKLSTNLGIGFVPLPLGSWRIISTNAIPAIAVASGNGGQLASDTAPALERVNGATDKQLRIKWVANGVEEVTAQFAYPPDLDDTANVEVHFLAAMANTNDTPTVAVGYFEGVGDSNAGGNSGAVTGTTVAEYSVAVTAANVAAQPNVASVTLIPAAHGNDALYVYATWIEYTRKA